MRGWQVTCRNFKCDIKVYDTWYNMFVSKIKKMVPHIRSDFRIQSNRFLLSINLELLNLIDVTIKCIK